MAKSKAVAGVNAKLLARVVEITCEQLGVDDSEVTLDSTFVDDLGADSLDIVELIMAFESEYAIEISDAEGEAMTRVKDAVQLVERKVAATRK